MALPPGFIDELLGRVSLINVVGRKVVWDSRKSNQAKGDMWAPCPFHQEKTPSFHVDDRKGYYYCFGCQAKGDAIGFVRETENVSFMEAVEILAREAGMQMPARDPKAAQQAEARTRLTDLMEEAVGHFRLQLRTSRAQSAREYLTRRGLQDEALERFEIGFAPDNRTALVAYLTGKGASLDAIVAAGLAISPDDGGKPFDRFRDRIMFPIRDPRGRCIAFGGRAMSPDARAKYLNSPETEIFHKGRTLYNHGPAREAAGKAGSLIVAEGYMDVIALAEAGFDHAVAPLGTAITEDQLRLMWRIVDEPLAALDGDKAGRKAAERLADLALPMMEAGKSLRIAMLPEGADPDDLIRAEGPSAMRAVLDEALPLSEILWRREVEGRELDSPERRAALDARLKAILARIGDPSVKSHYQADFRERRAALFRPAASTQPGGFDPRWSGGGRRKPGPPAGAAGGTRSSLLARSGPGDARIRESILLLSLVNHPALIEALEEELAELKFFCPDLDEIRSALLSAAADTLSAGADLDRSTLIAAVSRRLGSDPCAILENVPQARNERLARVDAPVDRVAKHVAAVVARCSAIAAQEGETADAERALPAAEGEGLTRRLAAALEARERAASADLEGEQDTNGEERHFAKVRTFLDNQIWVKKTKRGESP